MGRGERLIKRGDSWFSSKNIEVLPETNELAGGRERVELGALPGYQTQTNCEYL